jgi:hypothetical protein
VSTMVGICHSNVSHCWRRLATMAYCSSSPGDSPDRSAGVASCADGSLVRTSGYQYRPRLFAVTKDHVEISASGCGMEDIDLGVEVAL